MSRSRQKGHGRSAELHTSLPYMIRPPGREATTHFSLTLHWRGGAGHKHTELFLISVTRFQLAIIINCGLPLP